LRDSCTHRFRNGIHTVIDNTGCLVTAGGELREEIGSLIFCGFVCCITDQQAAQAIVHEKLAGAGFYICILNDAADQLGDIGGTFFLRCEFDCVLENHIEIRSLAALFAHYGDSDVAFM